MLGQFPLLSASALACQSYNAAPFHRPQPASLLAGPCSINYSTIKRHSFGNVACISLQTMVSQSVAGLGRVRCTQPFADKNVIFPKSKC